MKTYTQALCLLVVSFFAQQLSAREPGSSELKQFTQSSNLFFIENAGQITDQHYNLRKDINFKLNAPGLDIFIGNGQLHYQWTKMVDSHSHPPPAKGRDGEGATTTPSQVETYRLDVTLLGANKNARIIAEEKQDYYERYYLAHTPEDGVQAHSYKKITYQNIYSNIDWVLYIKDNQLKYDFVVHPGGNVKNIKLKYDGATDLYLKDGTLTAVTPFGSLTEQAPYSYEADSKKEIASAFVLNGDELSFDVEDDNASVIIDPAVLWSTYYGGNMEDLGMSVETDATGNLYMAGLTHSANNIATSGAHQVSPMPAGGSSYLVKLTSAGQRLWGTYYAGDLWAHVAYSQANNSLYLAGNAISTATGIATPGAHQPTISTTGRHGFLVNFDLNGQRLWGTYYSGANGSDVRCLHVDMSGNVYIGGSTTSPTGIATPGSHEPTHPPTAASQAFFAKFSGSGIRAWGTYYYGIYVRGIQSDKQGNVYITGATEANINVATPGSHQSSLIGNDNIYLAKFNQTGQRIWGTYYGGATEHNHWGQCIAYDSTGPGYVYIAGRTQSTINIASPGAHQQTLSGVGDVFLAKFDTAGTRQWATYFGGNGDERNGGVSCNPSGDVFIAGFTNSTSGIFSPGVLMPTAMPDDAFLAKFNSFGARQWSTYWGGNGDDMSCAIKWQAPAYIYMAGTTTSMQHLTTVGSHQLSKIQPYSMQELQMQELTPLLKQ